MPSHAYIKERRNGARREKTPYQAIDFWIQASGAERVTVPVDKSKGLTVQAWHLPDGRIVDATLISDEDAESREFMEGIANALVKDSSEDNLKKLEQMLRDRANQE